MLRRRPVRSPRRASRAARATAWRSSSRATSEHGRDGRELRARGRAHRVRDDVRHQAGCRLDDDHLRLGQRREREPEIGGVERSATERRLVDRRPPSPRASASAGAMSAVVTRPGSAEVALQPRQRHERRAHRTLSRQQRELAHRLGRQHAAECAGASCGRRLPCARAASRAGCPSAASTRTSTVSSGAADSSAARSGLSSTSDRAAPSTCTPWNVKKRSSTP